MEIRSYIYIRTQFNTIFFLKKFHKKQRGQTPIIFLLLIYSNIGCIISSSLFNSFFQYISQKKKAFKPSFHLEHVW